MKRTSDNLYPNASGAEAGHDARTPGGVPAPQAGAPNATAQPQGTPHAPGVAPRMVGYPPPYATAPGQMAAPQGLPQQLLAPWVTPVPAPFVPLPPMFAPFPSMPLPPSPWGAAVMPYPYGLPPVWPNEWNPFAANAIPAQPPAPGGNVMQQTAPEFHVRPAPSPHAGHAASGNSPSRYTRDRLFEDADDLQLGAATGRELNDLARWLPGCRAAAITLDGNEAATVAVVLHALRSNLNRVDLHIECSMDRFAPQLISQLTALLKSQTPLASLTLVLRDGDHNPGKFVLDQAFLAALFGHQHLEDIRFDFNEEETVWLHNPQQLADRIRNNHRLQTLTFEHCGELHSLFRAIAPGLEGNRSIDAISLRYCSMAGCGSAMAGVLRANPTITQLDMQFTHGWGCGDLQQIVEAMAVNTAVEQFHFFYAREERHSVGKTAPLAEPGEQLPELGMAIGAMLTANQHLRGLSIQCKLDLANLTPIRQGLNANTRLQFLDLGSITGLEDSEDTTDAGDAINELFATNSRLTSVILRPPGQSEDTDETVGLKGLVRNRSVQTLELDGADSVDGLKRLLNGNPRITKLTLTNYLRNSVSSQSMAQILEEIADAINGNTTLLEFVFEHDDTDLLLDKRVISALARFDELTTRNRQLDEQQRQQRQRVAAPATGIGMLNEFRRNEDATWPELRNEEATAIASAIDTALPQEEAQRVLDVLRFADIVNAQDEKASSGEHE